MATDNDGAESGSATEADPVDPTEAAGRRRWQIGVGISLLFGILGVAMSVLHYLHDAGPPSSTPAPAAAPAATGDAPKEKERGRGRGNGQ